MVTRLKRAIGAFTLASALFQIASIHAATYYVAPTGSNSNPGTSSKPWQTVAHAVNTMVAGDTTFVRNGTYSAHVRFRRSGTPSAPIKLLNYPGESPIIDCNSVGTSMVLIQHANGLQFPMGYITVEGFEIRKCHGGIKFHNLHDSVIRRNWIHDNYQQGILGHGIRILIERNIINHNGRLVCEEDPTDCAQDHGIYANGSAFTVTNNVIYDNQGNGIQLNGTVVYDPAKHAGPEFALSHNWIITHNTFAYQRHGNGIIVWGANCDNARIENNIFYENRTRGKPDQPQGINFTSVGGTTGVLIRNNLSYASGSGGTLFLGTSATEGVNYTQSGNIVNTRNPKFVNAPATLPASPSFALTAQSPAIDAGLSLAETKIAFDGTPRPQQRAYDIGAYEYKAGDDGTPPVAPIALQVR